MAVAGLVGWLWTKHHILLGPRCYFTSDPPLVEHSPCSKGGQGEGEAAVIAHQPVSQGIEPGTTESVDRKESPEPPAPRGGWGGGTGGQQWQQQGRDDAMVVVIGERRSPMSC